MKNYPVYLRNMLNSVIREMTKHPEKFCCNPGKDFTRNRKLPFGKVLSLLLKMGGHSLRDELLDNLCFKDLPASVSALVQQRSKILPEAMEHLFRRFTQLCERSQLYKGYHLLAVDGTDLQFTANPNDPLSYFPGTQNQMHYSLLHLNALYDLCSHCYLDAVVQKRRATNENTALIQMVDRLEKKHPAIIIADRGYEAYNILDHIMQRNWFYLIRVRENRSIISPLTLPDGEFDLPIQIYLTRSQTNYTKQLLRDYPGIYRYLPSTVTLDSLPPECKDLYPLSFRVVRFRTSDTNTVTLITNLDADTFPTDELKHLYHLRWGIETSFRHLKYTVGLSLFQSKKVEYVTQEIFARLTMYNFCDLITSHVVIQKKRRKYVYQTNFTAAVHICRQFLRGDVSPPNVETLISSYTVPLRPGRSTPRKTKSIKFNGFLYRIA